MIRSKTTSIFNYIYLYLMFNYSFIVNYVAHVDHSEFLLIFLSLIVVLVNYNKTASSTFSKPIVFWLFWCFYVIANYYFRQYSFDNIPIVRMVRLVFFPLLTMIVTAKEFKDNPKRLLILCVVALLSFALLGYFFDNRVLGREFDEHSDFGNRYPITICFLVFFLSVMQRAKHIPLWLYIVLVSIVVTIIAISGTRKAFGASVLMLFFWGLSLINMKKKTSLALLLIFAFLGIQGYNMLLEKTFIGQRLDYYQEQQELPLPSEAPKFLSIFGDRAAHYYYGFKQFEESPIFGVGLYRSSFNTGKHNLYIHTEYIAQLADNGIVGFSLFFSFYYWIGRRLIKKRKQDNELGMVMIGGFLMILFMNFTTWSWPFPPFFMCFGILIGYCQSNYDINVLRKSV